MRTRHFLNTALECAEIALFALFFSVTCVPIIVGDALASGIDAWADAMDRRIRRRARASQAVANP